MCLICSIIRGQRWNEKRLSTEHYIDRETAVVEDE